MKKKLVPVLFVLLAAGGAWWFLSLPDRIVSESAQVEGGVLGVGVSVPGKVREIYVKAGDKVAAEQPLFVLDTSGYEERLARERAHLAEIASTLPADMLVPSPMARNVVPEKPLAVLRAEEEKAQKSVEVASHVFTAANLALSRFDAKATPDKRGGPERKKLLIQRDEAALSLKNAKDAFETVSYARAKREALDKGLPSDKSIPAALAARIAEYQAQVSRVRLAEQALAATIVVAPEGGMVVSAPAAPGTFLEAGDMPIAILPDRVGELWVSAFFASGAAPALEVGRECFIDFSGEKEPLKGIIKAVRHNSDREKRVAVQAVPNKDGAISISMIGRDVSVFVVTGRMFFIPWFRKLP